MDRKVCRVLHIYFLYLILTTTLYNQYSSQIASGEVGAEKICSIYFKETYFQVSRYRIAPSGFLTKIRYSPDFILQSYAFLASLCSVRLTLRQMYRHHFQVTTVKSAMCSVGNQFSASGLCSTVIDGCTQ